MVNDDLLLLHHYYYHHHHYHYQRYKDVPNSYLNVSYTKAPSLVRWVSIPVYKDSNTKRLSPDGVLIKGDLVNGKTVAMER